MEFSITTEEVKGMWVVHLAGEVDLHTGPDFRTAVMEGIDGGYKQVVVDFSNASFIDSTALGILVMVVKRLKPYGGELHVVVSTPDIRKIFEITALDQILNLHDNLDSINI